MEKSKTIGQIYAYLVCLAAIIIAIVCVGLIVRSIFNYASPLNSNDYYSGYTHSYESFESYKTSVIQYSTADSKTATLASVSNDELRQAYNDEKSGYINRVKFDALKTITIDGLLILLAVILFFTHWRLAKHYQV